jgi:hypothetical protein
MALSLSVQAQNRRVLHEDFPVRSLKHRPYRGRNGAELLAGFQGGVAGALDPRLPPPGTYLEREYKGRRIIAKILEDGFEFDGEIYRSLSAIAQEATGTKWNGFLFFNLKPEENLNGKA